MMWYFGSGRAHPLGCHGARVLTPNVVLGFKGKQCNHGNTIIKVLMGIQDHKTIAVNTQ